MNNLKINIIESLKLMLDKEQPCRGAIEELLESRFEDSVLQTVGYLLPFISYGVSNYAMSTEDYEEYRADNSIKFFRAFNRQQQINYLLSSLQKSL